MKTSELSGAALDWAVCKAGGTTHIELVWETVRGKWSPSTNWAQGGTIIEREKIATRFDLEEQEWQATIAAEDEWVYGWGTTPLIAAMRCYVLTKLGNEVQIPEELQ
jgi:hypothetical protein